MHCWNWYNCAICGKTGIELSLKQHFNSSLALNLKLQTIFKDFLTFCVCSSRCHLCRPHSSRTHCWYSNDIHSVSSQVRWGCGVCRVVHAHKLEITLEISWIINNVVSNRLSSEILLWYVTPFHHKTSGACVVRGYKVRRLRWSWWSDRNSKGERRVYWPYYILSIKATLISCWG